jgi:hypothetical protein
MDNGLLLAWVSAAIFCLGICTSAILVIVEGRRRSEAHAFQLELISKRIAQREARKDEYEKNVHVSLKRAHRLRAQYRREYIKGRIARKNYRPDRLANTRAVIRRNARRTDTRLLGRLNRILRKYPPVWQ